MNLLLLEDGDFIAADRVLLSGRRLKHLHEVHRAEAGDSLRNVLVYERTKTPCNMVAGRDLTFAQALVLAIEGHGKRRIGKRLATSGRSA